MEDKIVKTKNILTYITVGSLISASLLLSGFRFPFFNNKTETPKQTTPITQGYEAVKNSVWCVTFQLVWNDFMDKFTNGKPVELAGGNPEIADELNKRLYTSDILTENSYYKTQGKINKKLKRNIEKNIKRKFNEKSDILSMVDWTVKDGYLFYAMLKKDFSFANAFDILTPQPFANSQNNVKYFGINKNSNYKLKDNVEILTYNDNEYAIKLLTKENEEIILLKTDKNGDFNELYTYIINKSKPEKFAATDTLKIPNININKTISYDELCGKQILGTNQKINQALQTIKFNMDNKGGSLKSEAVLGVMKMSLTPEISRHFDFDEPFVIFIKETNKNKPYFAAKIENIDFLIVE